MNLRMVFAALGVLMTAACAATPKDISVSSSSDIGLVVIEVEPTEDLRAHAQYNLGVMAFDPATGKITANFFGGWAGIDPQSAAVSDRSYLVGQAKPGVYALADLRISQWGVCYNNGTVRFDVRPGEVVFVGRYNPNTSLTELQEATRDGRVPRQAMQNQFFYLFDTPRPDLTPPDRVEGWRDNVRAYLSANFPNVSAPITQAVHTPAVFGTGRSLDGTIKLCGGYYAKGRDQAEPAVASATSTPA